VDAHYNSSAVPNIRGGWQMGEDRAIEPLQIAPLAYSTGELNRRPGLVTTVAIVSLIYGIPNFVINFGMSASGLSMIQMWRTQMIHMPQNRELYYQMYVAAILMIGSAAVDLLLAAMLLVGAIALLRQKYLGVRLHRVYVVVKLCIGLLMGTGLVPFLLGTQRWSDEQSIELIGCIYPISLSVLLWGKTFRRMRSGGSAFGFDMARPRWFTVLGIISMCVAVLTLFASILLITSVEIRRTIQAHSRPQLMFGRVAPSPQTAAADDKFYRYELLTYTFALIAFGLDTATAPVLLLGARQLLESDPRGIRVHRIYIAAKLAAAVLCALALAGLPSFTPFGTGGPNRFALYAIPAGAVYPLVLIFFLRGNKFQIRPVEAAA
jgi:hypothetical protein